MNNLESTREATIAAMTDPDEPGRAVSRDRYQARRTPGTPSPSYLYATFGSWARAVRAYGLLPCVPAARGCAVKEERRIPARPSPAKPRKRPTPPETDDAGTYNDLRTTLAQEAERGLPACGARTMPDGRVAWMLR